jgi:serine/threonine-protein kinase
MATTLTICLFRHDRVSIGHVGDCRVYVVQQGKIRKVTNDHSYAGVQLKLGLINVHEAASSGFRSVLTRTVGQEPMVNVDLLTVQLARGDVVVNCCDGVWSKITDGEILNIVTRRSPADACQEMVRLAERREADDNLTAQVVQVDAIERLSYYRGIATYQKESPAIMGSELEVGQVLDGRFKVTDLIARSGMAQIFKATDLKGDRVVALKVPLMQYESDPGFFSRFEREQAIGKVLNHPYILRMEFDESLEKSRPYIVMEYLQGQTLGHLMRQVKPLPVADALTIASRICEALHYMHEHDVVHRDLKPDNIMICSDGTIRLMDFGIAKFEGQRRLTFGGFTPTMGTPDYMAPEQVRGKRGDARTDIYSLGAILYEMVSGHVPFEGDNPFTILNARLSGDPRSPREWNPEISPQVEEIILRAMQRQPKDRYQTAWAMKQDLDHPEVVVVTGLVDRLVEPSPIRVGWRKIRILAIGVGLPLLVVLVIYLSRHLKWK